APPAPPAPPIAPPVAATPPPSNVVLIKNVPSFLLDHLRDWIAPCGNARTLLQVPNVEKGTTTLLVTMAHGDGGAWKLVQTLQSMDFSGMEAHLVPATPDIAMIAELPAVPGALVGQLSKMYLECEKGTYKKQEAVASTTTPAAPAAPVEGDEDEDPLETPVVLEAVKAFRRKLETSETVNQRKRKQVVQQRLKELKERWKQGPPPPPAAGPPPPPAPIPLPPPPSGLPPPLPPVDLKRLLPPPPVQSESSNKKAKLDPTVMETALRAYISERIQHYLGEEEVSLIDFCSKHMLENKPMGELLKELEGVLEEDAKAFCKGLEAKWKQLSGN
ncbi:MAG: hypothetical protein AAGJ35_13980, partial [Myxococcota bacterium]